MKYCDVSYLLCYHSHCHTGNSLLSRTPLTMDLKVKDNKENHISKRTSFSVGVNLSTDRQKGEKCKRKKKKKRIAKGTEK